jgi:hypothetical protein
MTYFLKVRRNTAFTLGVLALQLLGLLIGKTQLQLHEDSAFAVPWVVLLPSASAIVIGLAAGSAATDLERQAARRLGVLRLCSCLSLVVLAAIGAAILGSRTAGPYGTVAAVRNSIGTCGLALLAAATLGSRFSWILPVAWTALAMTLSGEGLQDRYLAWPVAPDHAPHALGVAMLLGVAGLAAVAAVGTRERRDETFN